MNNLGNKPKFTRSGFSDDRLIKYSILYLFYVGIVLAVGMKLGAFHWRTLPQLKIDAALQTSSTFASGVATLTDKQLPEGILAFDATLKKDIVHEGDTQAHFIFTFTNLTSESVIISKVSTSCGCTTAKLPPMPWTLAPHTKGQIPVNMNLPYFTGTRSKTVTVTTFKGFQTLTVEADILPHSSEESTNTIHP